MPGNDGEPDAISVLGVLVSLWEKHMVRNNDEVL